MQHIIKQNILALMLSMLSISGFSQTFTMVQDTVPDDGGGGDLFGSSVAISGNYAIVGAYEHDTGGAVFFYELSGGDWEIKQMILNPGSSDDKFGYSVSISGDRAIVGARSDGGGGTLAGAAYIYEYDDTDDTWKIMGSGLIGAAGAWFGCSVSISGDRAIIGAMGVENYQGAAYIYEYNGTWILETELKMTTSPQPNNDDQYGFSVAISGDTLAIVGVKKDDPSGLDAAGTAFIFEYDASLGEWERARFLKASDRVASDHFGCSVAISGDKAIVGAHYAGDTDQAGKVYIFDGSANWSEMQILQPDFPEVGGYFGESVAISISGDTVIVGAPWMNSYAGAVYIYALDETGTWNEISPLTYDDSHDTNLDDQFGNSVAISGGEVIVGANRNDNKGSNSGSAYIFESDAILPIALIGFSAIPMDNTYVRLA
ncbi:MAG: hypothetical protein GY816_09170 [Cytophagales bacterium]|nr:hypothetical protein [Cytophagales bacterium]